MRRSLLGAVLLAFRVAFAQDTSVANDSDEDFFSRCGNGDPSDLIIQATKDLAKEAADAAGRTIGVDTYFHVVESKAKEGYVTKTMLDDQVCLFILHPLCSTCACQNSHACYVARAECHCFKWGSLDTLNYVDCENRRVKLTSMVQLTVLNLDYGRYGITFNLIDVDYAINDSWATGTYDAEMKPALHQGGYADLNLYFLTDLQNDILGICPFPLYPSTLTSDTFNQDGCKVLAGALPGGDIPNYNKGRTATHEVGHWFGLVHPFQGESCTGDGDFVDDTPQQDSPTLGCPISRDTCPDAPGLDNIHNYMDYSYDDW